MFVLLFFELLLVLNKTRVYQMLPYLSSKEANRYLVKPHNHHQAYISWFILH